MNDFMIALCIVGVLAVGLAWFQWVYRPGRAYAIRIAASERTRHTSGEYVVDLLGRLSEERAKAKRHRAARLDSELAAWETAPTAMQPVLTAT